MSLTATEIKIQLSIQGYLTYCDPTILDAEYSLPDSDWVFNEFASALRTSLPFGYTRENFDCDDYAFFAKVLAGLAHRNSSPDVKTGIAIGIFAYVKENGVAHMINFFFTKDEDEIKIVCFEPQTGGRIYLSEKERETIAAIII